MEHQYLQSKEYVSKILMPSAKAAKFVAPSIQLMIYGLYKTIESDSNNTTISLANDKKTIAKYVSWIRCTERFSVDEAKAEYVRLVSDLQRQSAIIL